MKINLFDVNKVITINNLQEVTNPIFFNNGNIPTSDGLLSYEIFGRLGSDERKTNYAYINLKEKFLHPLAFKSIVSMDRKIANLLNGTSYFRFNTVTNQFEEDNENGKTGIKFFYNNFDNYLKGLKITNSQSRKDKIKFLTTIPKSSLFQDKVLVCPAFYRDVNFKNNDKGKINVGEPNNLYSKLINLASGLDRNMGSDFMLNVTMSNIQLTLNALTDFFISYIKKSDGFFHKAIMGKTIDRSVRSVISADSMNNYHSYKDMEVDCTHTGVPLYQVCILFFDFIMKWLDDFFERELGYLVYMDNTKGQAISLKDAKQEFSYDEIKKNIERFIKSPSERFETIKVQTSSGLKEISYAGRLSRDGSENTICKDNRPLTWTDVLYLAAVDVVKDKHIYITRYPLLDYLAIYPSRISVLSTFKTAPQYFEGTYYKNYPLIDLKMSKDKISNYFIDSLRPFNGCLAALGGDYDGK